MARKLLAIAGVLLGMGCTEAPKEAAEPSVEEDGTTASEDTDEPDDTDEPTDSGEPTDTGDGPRVPPTPAEYCVENGLTVRGFDGSSPGPTYDGLAPDASFTLVDGSTWTLSDAWTGCDTVYLLSAGTLGSRGDYPTLKDADSVADWFITSPLNVQIVFFSDAASEADRLAELTEIEAAVDAALVTVGGETAEQLSQRIFYAVDASAEAELLSDFEPDFSTLGVPFAGLVVDRLQAVREIGYLCDPLTGWETCPAVFLAYEAIHHNFESNREDRMAAMGDVTVIPVFEAAEVSDAGWAGARTTVDVTLPDAATMATFDTLELDLDMRCTSRPELAGCPAWDYLVHLYLCDEDDPATTEDESTQCGTEVGRWITTYWRAGRWVHDITPYLALLQDGGTRRFAFYSQQTYEIDLSLRLSNQGVGMRPTALEPLFSGGYLTDTYNWGAVHSYSSATGLWAIRVFDGDSGYETTVVDSDLDETGGWLVGENPRTHPYGRFDFTRLDLLWGEDVLYWCDAIDDAATEAEARDFVYACAEDDPDTPEVDESTTCWGADRANLETGCNGGAWHILTPGEGAAVGTLDGDWIEVTTPSRLPKTIEVPESVVGASIMAVITGHGGASGDNCAEFCDHQHTFTVDEADAWTREHPMVGDLYGCADQVADGTIPNQAGTWVYGRGGWCPGMEVDPWVVDVTASVLDGDPHTVSYLGLVGGDVRRRGGHGGARIDMVSYLVHYE